MTTPKICMVGSSMVDLISRIPRFPGPGPGETVHGTAFHLGYGGKGSNQAVMAARLGAQVSVVVKLGRDVFGEGTAKNYREQGIDDTYVMFDDERFSGVAPITVDEETGQNAIIVIMGANFGLTPAEVRNARPAIWAADVVMCQLEIPIESSLEAFRVAKERHDPITTIMNPAPAAALPRELLQITDILVPNEVETAMLSGMSVSTVDECIAAAKALQRQGPRSVILTLGERGALVLEGDEPPHHVTAPRVQAVDTTGAGDAFVGSLAYFLAAGKPMVEAAQRAVAIASRSVLKIGTQTSFPYRDEVAELLT
ncbi:MAG: ribokinase [Burkholderiales bacterium]|nr:ribokinase [Anaerolineae bacterium]